MSDLRQEIDLLSQLDHPNVVKIVNAFENENEITLIMDLCEGGELFDNLLEPDEKGEVGYTSKRAAFLFKQMVDAVGYCHKMGVTHRDLKLENFCFTDKEHKLLQLIDFGLSKKFTSGYISDYLNSLNFHQLNSNIHTL